MTNLVFALFLAFSPVAYPDRIPATDDIDRWRVYNGGKLLREGTRYDHATIVLKKEQIRAADSLYVEYFDDTPCSNCEERLTIKTESGRVLKTIANTITTYELKIKTTQLQDLSTQNQNATLWFYYREDPSKHEILVFKLTIR